jgi:hypothetical protein
MIQDKFKLRAIISANIIMLSHKFSKEQIYNYTYLDVDNAGNIIGYDMSQLYNLDYNACVGKRIPLCNLTEYSWNNMKFEYK